ncbi:MAG: outer membrane protein assembly factor BamA [Hyphomonadaceae bacterium]
MRSLFVIAMLVSSAISFVTGQYGASTAIAQEAPSGAIIRSIIVEGNQRIEARTVQSYLLVEPGDPFDGERLDLSLKTLFATNLFADVAFDQRGTDLVVRVVENPVINRVIFEGNKALDDDKLVEEIQAAPRGIFTAARVQADVQRIIELYRKSGRFAAQVKPQYKPLEQNRVDLVFDVTEGPVTGVRSINFLGNDAYSDRQLRSEVVTRQSRWWRFFSSNDNYDPDRLEYDRELLRQLYQNHGYYDFRVSSAVADLTPDQKDFYITFTVDEGEQYTFGEINVETALEKLDNTFLRRTVPIKSGELYQGDLIEQSIDALTFAAGIAGYAFVDIRPRIVPNPETNQVDVTFAIDEGPRVYIERINIVGNTTTLDRVVRRELRISEGDAFNRVLLDRSRNRARALGFFKDVTIEERPGSEPDRTIVDIAVEEQPTGELSFSAGFSSVDAFLVDFSVSQRNLRGTGQSLVARVSASSRQQLIEFRFTEPRFLGRNIAAGLDVFSTKTDFLDFGQYEASTIGAGARISFPVSERTSLGLNYQIRSDDINVRDFLVTINESDGTRAALITPTPRLDGDGNPVLDDNDVPIIDDITSFIPADQVPLPTGVLAVDQCDIRFVTRQTICFSERNELTSLLGYSFRWDRRNDPIEPTRGFDFSLNQGLAGIGGDVKYLKTEAALAGYRGLFKGFRATARISGGYIFPFGDNETLRINNRFFKGGNSFRGFDVAGLGPRVIDIVLDENNVPTGKVTRGNALGGKAYYLGTVELTIPNYLPEEYGIKSALFADFGGVGILDDASLIEPFQSLTTVGGQTFPSIRTIKDPLTLRATAGLSVFWRSPFGPIRFDFSQILLKEEYDRTESFRFSTSTSF